MGLASDLWFGLLDLLYPPRCAGCGVLAHGALCHECRACLQPIRDVACERCGAPLVGAEPPPGDCSACRNPRAFAGLRGAFLYQGPMREAICALKFRGRVAAAQTLADLLVWAVENADSELLSLRRIPFSKVDLVCPVPLHPRRLRARGFNQAALLAKPLASHLRATFDEGLLMRVRDTRPQPGLTARDRERNMAGAFTATEGLHPIAGATVLVVDDVATTGATMSQCAAALLGAGALRVWAVALARGVHLPDEEEPRHSSAARTTGTRRAV